MQTNKPKRTLKEQILAVQREIKLRQKVYPRLVGQGKMTAEEAENEIDTMRAVLETLQSPAVLTEAMK